MCLEDKVLLKTFSFLVANSVIATAVVCRPLFSRVNNLFGMGSSALDAPPVIPPPNPTPSPAVAAAAAIPLLPAAPGVDDTAVDGGGSAEGPGGGKQAAKKGWSLARSTTVAKTSAADARALQQLTEKVRLRLRLRLLLARTRQRPLGQSIFAVPSEQIDLTSLSHVGSSSLSTCKFQMQTFEEEKNADALMRLGAGEASRGDAERRHRGQGGRRGAAHEQRERQGLYGGPTAEHIEQPTP